MRLRLFRRSQADPPRPGRHARLLVGPTVPGAAATLVASAMPWEHRRPAVPADAAPVLGVSLGFADGAQVDLAPDDPRARPFRAAAAALLEQHRV